MNANKIVWLIIGAAVGAGAGYALATVIYDQMNDEEFDEFEDDEELSEDSTDEIITEISKPRKKKGTVDYTAKFKESENPDLQRLAAKYKEGVLAEGSSVMDQLEKDLIKERDLEDDDFALGSIDTTKPYLISREDFEEQFLQSHKKVYLHYYEDDDVLTVAEDNTIVTSDPEKFLGPDALESFGLKEDDPDYVHVRNEILGNDYEIQLLHESFEKKIIGDREKKVKDRSPRKNKQVEMEEDE